MTMAMNVLTILAQTTTQAAQPEQPFLLKYMFPILAIMVIFMIMSGRSKRRTEKERQAQLATMKRGDRVQTVGGILGTVVEVRDSEVVVKVDETNNTKIKLALGYISRVTSEEDKDKDKDKDKEKDKGETK
jgi:preprotein translocase subunit YajC